MLTQFIFVVFFVYGLAFFGMGLAMALESGRSPSLAEARILRPLAAFGLLHGTHEWMESYLLQAESVGMPLSPSFAWVKLALLVSSFSSLMLFAYHLLQFTSRGAEARRVSHFAGYFFYASALFLSAYLTYRSLDVPWLALLSGLSRYLLAVPASMLAAIGLRAWAREAREEKRNMLSLYLSLTALGFGIYAVTQVFISPIAMFPAQIVNELSFMAVFGFPIQIIRTLMAILISINLLRATYVMDDERKAQLLLAQQSRLDALRKEEALRRDLLRHTVRAQEEERARIARELHDETAQELTAFSLELATLRSMLKRQKAAADKVEHLQNLSSRVSQGLYRLVRDLRPAQLDDLGLVAALRYLTGQHQSNMNIEVDFKLEGDAHRLDPLIETVLFRVAQEALTNVARHAKTREAALRLCFEEEQVHLTVADQGQGFDANIRFAALQSWGLAGMRERVESVDGVLNLTSMPGEGTKIEVTIPINREAGGSNGHNHDHAGGRS